MTDYFTAEQVYQSLKEENAALQKFCHEKHAELETLRTGYAAARLEIESLHGQQNKDTPMTTPTTHGQVPAIQRYKIGYHADEWGQRSSTPSGIPDASGSWVRYADHVTALAAGQATAAQQPTTAYAALPDAPLSVFSEGPWTLKETGQNFSGAELDEAAFVAYRDRASHGQAPVQAAPESFLEIPDVQDESGINSHYSRELVLECINSALASHGQAPASKIEGLAAAQESLGVEFEKVLHDNLFDLYEESAPHGQAPAGETSEQELEDALRERDDADDFIDALLDEVLGAERAEWSSAYGRADALEEVRERITALHKPAVDRAWTRFEAATEQPAQAAPQQEAQHPAQTLIDPENQPNQYSLEFGMSGPQMHFKIGNQLFKLAYEPDEQEEFEFMQRMLINAFSNLYTNCEVSGRSTGGQEP